MEYYMNRCWQNNVCVSQSRTNEAHRLMRVIIRTYITKEICFGKCGNERLFAVSTLGFEPRTPTMSR